MNKHLLTAAVIVSFCSGCKSFQEVMVGHILELPSYLVHEEDENAFEKRLGSGVYWKKNGAQYVFVNGDGVYGQRVFVLTANSELYILIQDNVETFNGELEAQAMEVADDLVDISYYDNRTRSLVPISSIRIKLHDLERMKSTFDIFDYVENHSSY